MNAWTAVALGSAVLIVAGCGRQTAPVRLDRCAIASHASGSGFVVTYTLRYTNVSGRPIRATRIGTQPWADAAVPIAENATGVPDDDIRRLAPSETRVLHFRTSLIVNRQRRPSPQALACKVVSVVFEDGTQWIAHPGFALPLLFPLTY